MNRWQETLLVVLRESNGQMHVGDLVDEACRRSGLERDMVVHEMWRLVDRQTIAYNTNAMVTLL